MARSSGVYAIALLAFATPSHAAGLKCSAAITATEKAICANTNILELDSRLSLVYGNLMSGLPDASARIRQEQLAWVKTRDHCGDDTDCLSEQYLQRIAVLEKRLHKELGYRPDSVDRQALDDLRQAVEAAGKVDPEFPLEKAIKQFQVKSGTTSFAGARADEESNIASLPSVKPAGVTDSEWRALLASQIEAEGEHGDVTFKLIDIDGDGKRDLVIESYVGGTGIWSEISVLRQTGGRFVADQPASVPDQSNQVRLAKGASRPSYLYMLNGRGANQFADWIRLQGRVYAAYRDGRYGVDSVYLLRPWTTMGQAPRLNIQYRYQLSIPKFQKREDQSIGQSLDTTLHQALGKALALVSPSEAHDIGPHAKPICPLPNGASIADGDDAYTGYYSYGMGHYSVEIVEDMPIWIGRQCYMGRMIDSFGYYSTKSRLGAQLCMRKPEADATDQSQRCYQVRGVRKMTGIDTAISTMKNAVGLQDES